MKTTSNKRTFLISAAIALTAVVIGGGALGFINNGSAADAVDSLPSGIDGSNIGDGGVDPTTVHLAAESSHFQVLTARDRANNTCLVVAAIPEGNSSGFCVSEEQFQRQGLPSSMQVGEAEQGDDSITMLQTYLLPDGADAKAAAAQIPGSEVYGQLIVRYGPLEVEKTTKIEVPTNNGTINMSVFGRDSI